jgi:hypothetical protein
MKGQEIVAVAELQETPENTGLLILELNSATPIDAGHPDGIIPAVVGCLGMGEEFGAIVALFGKG